MGRVNSNYQFFTPGEQRGRVPTKEWVCPDCLVKFVAYGTTQGATKGKTCPNGHFYSIAQLQYFEKKGTKQKKRPEKVYEPKLTAVETPAPILRAAKIASLQSLGFARKSEQAELALQWWITGYERLIEQVPEDSVLRSMIEGALGRIHRLSLEILPTNTIKAPDGKKLGCTCPEVSSDRGRSIPCGCNPVRQERQLSE